MYKTDEEIKKEYYEMNPVYSHLTTKQRKVKEAVRRFGHTESYWKKVKVKNLFGITKKC